MLLAQTFLERHSWIPDALIAVIVLVIGTGITLYLRNRDKKTKTFDYRVVSDVAIVRHRPDDDDLKVMYRNEELVNPRLVQVQFANTGTESIRPSEILQSFVLLTHGARIVRATMVESSRVNLASFEIVGVPDTDIYGVRLAPETLNSGDNLTLKLIVDGEEGPVTTSFSGCVEGETRPPGWLTTAEHRRLLTEEVFYAWLGAASSIGIGLWGLYSGIALWLAITLIVSGIATGTVAFGAFLERRRRVNHGWPGAQGIRWRSPGE